MGFSINFHGSVGAVYNIEVAAGATVHIGCGDGSHSHPSGKFQGETCPVKTTKAQRTEWGAQCTVDHVAPEGWTAETFTSERAFTNNSIPDGLTRGDAIFYWKKGVTETDVPNGFVAVHGAGDIIIIVPVSSEIDLPVFDDDDDDDDSSLDGNDDGLELPTSSNIISDDDGNDLLSDNNDDDEEDDNPSPF